MVRTWLSKYIKAWAAQSEIFVWVGYMEWSILSKESWFWLKYKPSASEIFMFVFIFSIIFNFLQLHYEVKLEWLKKIPDYLHSVSIRVINCRLLAWQLVVTIMANTFLFLLWFLHILSPSSNNSFIGCVSGGNNNSQSLFKT